MEGPFVRVGNTNRDKRVTLLSELVLPTEIKGVGPFVPGRATNPDKRAGLVAPPGTKGPCPPLARLAFGPGTKATFCPGPKDNRDK